MTEARWWATTGEDLGCDRRGGEGSPVGEGALVGGLGFGVGFGVEVEIAQEAVAEAVDPAVHGEGLAAVPGVAHDGRLAYVHDLLDDVHLAKAVELVAFAGEVVEAGVVFQAYVLHVAQPVVGEAHAFAAQGGAHAAAAVVADDHDV